MEGSFTLNSLMGLAGIAILPAYIWFASRRITLKLFLFGSLLLLVFSRGTLEILGGSTVITRIIVEGLVLVCFVFTVIMTGSPKKKLPGVFFLVAFSFVAFSSIVYNDVNGVMLLLFFRDYLFSIVFIYTAFNASMSEHEVRVVIKLVAFLLVSQIFANLVKVAVLGDIVESYIGTMANLGGSLTIIFSLLGSAVSISFYLITKQKKYLLLLLGFIAFSIIGGKRAALVYIPFIYLFLLFMYQIQSGIRVGNAVKQVVLFSCISLVLVYMSLRLMPSLNPEREVWGSFDVEYAMDYSARYVTTGAGAIERIGRMQAPAYLLTKTASDSSFHLLLGYGAGHLIKSRFNDSIADSGSQSDLTMDLYGVGYGARTAFLQLFLQVGLVGVALYLALWFRIFRAAYAIGKQYQGQQSKRLGSLILLGVSAIFVIDFFTYSVVAVQLGVISILTAIIIFLYQQFRKVPSYDQY